MINKYRRYIHSSFTGTTTSKTTNWCRSLKRYRILYNMMLPSIIFNIILFILLLPTAAWQEWNYSSTPNDEYKQLWLSSGLGDRRGHTLVLYNESKVVLFGGRSNDAHRPHVPQTFELVEGIHFYCTNKSSLM